MLAVIGFGGAASPASPVASREQLERGHDAVAIFGGHAAHDGVDLAAALVHHDVDETLTLRR